MFENFNVGNNDVKPKRPDTKGYILYDSIYVRFRKRHTKSAVMGVRFVVT